jgi:ribosomal protein S12 methylthiotransferase accessory factor
MENLHNTTSTIEVTLQAALAFKLEHGITRLADITNFSKINLPVWIAIRPNAKCLSQSAGKGITSDASKLSALMEGIEVSYAEKVDSSDSKIASHDSAYIDNVKCIEISHYPVRPIMLDKCNLSWSLLENIKTQEFEYFPSNMLSLDFTQNLIGVGAKPIKFKTTSNGVASGKTVVEATVSALLEVIERHSITLMQRLKRTHITLDLGDFNSDVIDFVISEIKSGGGNVMLFDSTVVNGVYTIEAVQWSENRDIPLTHGMGASLSLEIAILRALLEANQASTIILSGSRDDITKSSYTTHTDYEKLLYNYTSHSIGVKTLSSNDKKLFSMPPEVELQNIVNFLEIYNNQPIYRYIYTPPDCSISAVKVLVPKMEGYYINGYKPVSLEGKDSSKSFSRYSETLSSFDLAAGGQG